MTRAPASTFHVGPDSLPESAPAALEPVPRLLTTAQAAEALAISSRQVQTLAASGELRSVRIGRLLRFRPADLRSFIDTAAGGNDA